MSTKIEKVSNFKSQLTTYIHARMFERTMNPSIPESLENINLKYGSVGILYL